jgi:RNA polymerase sigma-70 factor (ECF subfamily)
MSLAHVLPLETPIPGRASQAQARPSHLQVIPGLYGQETGVRVAELYERFGPAISRRCRRLLRDEVAADDATQEVFLRLVRHGGALSTRSDLLPWLYRVASNHCYNVLRQARGHAEAPFDAVEEPSYTPVRSAPASRLMRQVLSRFDEATQAIAVGIIVEGMEAEELARQMGVSRRTISRKLDRFLEKARACLQDGVPA